MFHIPTPDSSSDLTPFLRVEQWQTPALIGYVFYNVARATVDVWHDHYMGYLAELNSETPFRTFMDVSATNISFTPYVKDRTTHIIQTYPLKGYAAFVLSNRLLAPVLELFMRSATQGRVMTQIFTEREKALGWLMTQ